MKIENECGAILVLESLYVKHTYSGLLAGTKAAATRFWLEDLSRLRIPNVNPEVPVVGVGLSRFRVDSESELPSFSFRALFVAMRGTTDTDSQLLVAWFQESLFEPPNAAVINEIKSLDWNRLAIARDYYG